MRALTVRLCAGWPESAGRCGELHRRSVDFVHRLCADLEVVRRVCVEYVVRICAGEHGGVAGYLLEVVVGCACWAAELRALGMGGLLISGWLRCGAPDEPDEQRWRRGSRVI